MNLLDIQKKCWWSEAMDVSVLNNKQNLMFCLRAIKMDHVHVPQILFNSTTCKIKKVKNIVFEIYYWLKISF